MKLYSLHTGEGEVLNDTPKEAIKILYISSVNIIEVRDFCCESAKDVVWRVWYRMIYSGKYFPGRVETIGEKLMKDVFFKGVTYRMISQWKYFCSSL